MSEPSDAPPNWGSDDQPTALGATSSDTHRPFAGLLAQFTAYVSENVPRAEPDSMLQLDPQFSYRQAIAGVENTAGSSVFRDLRTGPPIRRVEIRSSCTDDFPMDAFQSGSLAVGLDTETVRGDLLCIQLSWVCGNSLHVWIGCSWQVTNRLKASLKQKTYFGSAVENDLPFLESIAGARLRGIDPLHLHGLRGLKHHFRRFGLEPDAGPRTDFWDVTRLHIATQTPNASLVRYLVNDAIASLMTIVLLSADGWMCNERFAFGTMAYQQEIENGLNGYLVEHLTRQFHTFDPENGHGRPPNVRPVSEYEVGRISYGLPAVRTGLSDARHTLLPVRSEEEASASMPGLADDVNFIEAAHSLMLATLSRVPLSCRRVPEPHNLLAIARQRGMVFLPFMSGSGPMLKLGAPGEEGEIYRTGLNSLKAITSAVLLTVADMPEFQNLRCRSDW